jgi:hypothetical protein
MTEDEFRALALAYPGAEEGFNLGSAFFKVNGKVLARLVAGERAMLTGVPIEEIEMLTEADPELYWADAHHKNARCLVARLARFEPSAARAFLERRFREVARKSVLKAWEASA